MKIGITIGDLNGIGPEIILKTFSDERIFDFCTPVLYGSSKIISYHRKALKIEEFSFNNIREPSQANQKKLNIINSWLEDVVVELGRPTEPSGRYALKAIDAAVADLKNGKLDALVTAPIHKGNIPAENFTGHTEYLAKAFGTENFLMMMVNEEMKIAVASGHVPMRKTAELLGIETLLNKIKHFNQSLLKDFIIRKPKIAVLGFNPHAGENGTIGTEDRDIVTPAINKAKEDNMLVYGPYPADGFFGSNSFKKFDGILAMYHDQGMIPFKLLSFDYGVNFTAGLPVVRTSPDHGTAFDIAGKGVASETSFREAVLLAGKIFSNRKLHGEMTSNPLRASVLEKES